MNTTRVLTIIAVSVCLLVAHVAARAADPDIQRQLQALTASRMDIIGAKPAYMAPVAMEDLTQLSPLCAELLRHQRRSEQNPKFGSWESSMRASGLLDEPQFAILRNAGSFHHYCWGELAQNRYYREIDRQKKKGLAQYAASSYKYIIDHPQYLPHDWPYMPKMYVAYGAALLLTNETAAATGAFLTALHIDPSYIPAYINLADLYASGGAKAKALVLVTEGLRYHPESKALQRYYGDLGGKPPYPKPYLPPPKNEAPSEAAPAEQSEKKDASAAPSNAAPVTNNAASAKSSPNSEANPSGKKDMPTTDAPVTTVGKSPYCRFCPD